MESFLTINKDNKHSLRLILEENDKGRIRMRVAFIYIWSTLIQKIKYLN